MIRNVYKNQSHGFLLVDGSKESVKKKLAVKMKFIATHSLNLFMGQGRLVIIGRSRGNEIVRERNFMEPT